MEAQERIMYICVVKGAKTPGASCKVDVNLCAAAIYERHGPALLESRYNDVILDRCSLITRQALSGRDFNGGFVISVNDPLTAHLALFDNISGIVFHVRDGVRAHVGQQQLVRQDGQVAAPRRNFNQALMQSRNERMNYIPPKKIDDTSPIVFGNPSINLAYNHVIDSFTAFGIAMRVNSEKDKDCVVEVVKNLAHVVRYICPFIDTINARHAQLHSHIAHLGFSFVKASEAQSLTCTEDQKQEWRSSTPVTIRIPGQSQAAPYYRFRYFHPKRNDRWPSLESGLVTHSTEKKDGRIVKVSLLQLVERLDFILLQPWASKEKCAKNEKLAAWVRSVEYIREAMSAHDRENEQKKSAAAERRSQTREEVENRSDYIPKPKDCIPPSKEYFDKFSSLSSRLRDTDLFTPISLDDFFQDSTTAANRVSNSRYREQLLEGHGPRFHIAYVALGPSGPGIHQAHYVWKVPRVVNEVDVNLPSSSAAPPTITLPDLIRRNYEIVTDLRKRTDVNGPASRRMLKDFKEYFHDFIADVPEAAIRHMYSHLTGFSVECTHERTKEMDEIVRAICLRQDQDSILDLRELNTSNNKCFDLFFDIAHGIIEEKLNPKVGERRHGNVNASESMTVTDLYVHCVSAFEKEKEERGAEVAAEKAPSENYFYLQFVPTHSNRAASGRYTGAFALSLKVLSRTYRASHLDEHYGAAIRRYFMHMCVLYKEHAIAISLDDKSNIPVGDPNRPMASVERGRRVLMSQDRPLEVMDHDAGSGMLKLIPTVTMLLDVPDQIDGAWMRGDVFVTLKSSVFEQSTALRSAGELHLLLEAAAKGDFGQEVQRRVTINTSSVKRRMILALSDGGTEHRTTFASVWIALISLWKKGEYDYICFVRTCPGQSWLNFVERVMSIINIALSGLSVMRESLDESLPDGRKGPLEQLLMSCKTMKDIREKAKDNSDLKEAILKACGKVEESIMEAVLRRSLKGRPFQKGVKATEEQIDEFWSVIRFIAKDVSREDTKKGSLKNHKDLQSFLDSSHFVLNQYSLTIYKHCWHDRFVRQAAGEQVEEVHDCPFKCSPPLIPKDVFLKLYPIPMPQKLSDDATSFMPFEDVYDKGHLYEREEKWRPSRKEKERKQKKMSNQMSSVGKKKGKKDGQMKPDNGTTLERRQNHTSVKADNVWKTIHCTEDGCNKARIVYLEKECQTGNKSKLGEKLMDVILEKESYRCGDPLPIVNDSSINWDVSWQGVEKAMAVDVRMDCATPLSRFFYTKKVGVGNPYSFCVWCGGADGVKADEDVDEDYPHGFNTVLPRCLDCKGKGLKWIAWGRTSVNQAEQKRKAKDKKRSKVGKPRKATAGGDTGVRGGKGSRSRPIAGGGRKKDKGKGFIDSSSADEEDDEEENDDMQIDREGRKGKGTEESKGGESGSEDGGAVDVEEVDVEEQQKEGESEEGGVSDDGNDDILRRLERRYKRRKVVIDSNDEGDGKGMEEEEGKREEEEKVYCYCQQSMTYGTPRTIGCDERKGDCKEWYHLDCIKAEEGGDACKHAEDMVEGDLDWVCGLCKE